MGSDGHTSPAVPGHSTGQSYKFGEIIPFLGLQASPCRKWSDEVCFLQGFETNEDYYDPTTERTVLDT